MCRQRHGIVGYFFSSGQWRQGKTEKMMIYVFARDDVRETAYRDEEGEFFILPGGGQVHGETLIQGALRETKEETNLIPKLHEVGCMGKIVSFKESEDGRFLIELKGLIRFQIEREIESTNKYREFEINFEKFFDDLHEKKENIKFSDLELIFKDLKSLFEKRGFIINWKGLEKQGLDETINALAMASPFTVEEKQVLLEAKNLKIRKTKISEILTTYSFDQYNNTTIQ